MAARSWALESFGDSRTTTALPEQQTGWPTRSGLVHFIRGNLGLTVARDGYVYPTRNTHTTAIGRIYREGNDD